LRRGKKKKKKQNITQKEKTDSWWKGKWFSQKGTTGGGGGTRGTCSRDFLGKRCSASGPTPPLPNKGRREKGGGTDKKNNSEGASFLSRHGPLPLRSPGPVSPPRGGAMGAPHEIGRPPTETGPVFSSKGPQTKRGGDAGKAQFRLRGGGGRPATYRGPPGKEARSDRPRGAPTTAQKPPRAFFYAPLPWLGGGPPARQALLGTRFGWRGGPRVCPRVDFKGKGFHVRPTTATFSSSAPAVILGLPPSPSFRPGIAPAPGRPPTGKKVNDEGKKLARGGRAAFWGGARYSGPGRDTGEPPEKKKGGPKPGSKVSRHLAPLPGGHYFRQAAPAAAVGLGPGQRSKAGARRLPNRAFVPRDEPPAGQNSFFTFFYGDFFFYFFKIFAIYLRAFYLGQPHPPAATPRN